MTGQISYNVLFEPWIPAVRLDGTPVLISLREALANAPAYRGISASLPHASAAVLRLLLAVLHRVFGPATSSQWADLWQSGGFSPTKLDAYFEQYHSHFDLFDPHHPFYQQRHPLLTEKPAQALLQIVGGGDTYALFDHIMDNTPFALSPDEAALLLVTSQSFGLAGLCHPQLKLVYTDAPCSRAAVFFVEGRNLFETLMFNLVRYNRSTPMTWDEDLDDRAFWEAEDDPYLPERNKPLGYVDYLTWPNRKISLIPADRDGKVVVEQVVLGPGLTLDASLHNPMHHYRRGELDKKTGNYDFRVLRFSEDRALWRDSHALLDFNGGVNEVPASIKWMGELFNEGILPRRHLQMTAYGMCTEPGKQKVNFYRGEGFELDSTLLNDRDLLGELNTALKHAEALRSELWVVLNRLATQYISIQANLEGGRQPDSGDVKKLMAHWNAEELYWNRLELDFYPFLQRLPDDPEQAMQNWNGALKRAFRGAFNQTVAALGDDARALKAAALTQGWLSFSLKKILPDDVSGEE